MDLAALERKQMLEREQAVVDSLRKKLGDAPFKRFELVQLHECGDHAEVVVRDANGCEVFAGNIGRVDNPKAYY